MILEQMLTASKQVLHTSLVLAFDVAAVDHPPVAHEHAVEVGSQDRLRVFESAARADGVDGRRRGDGRPQPVAAGADAPTGFIGRDHRSVANLLAQRLVGRPRVAGRTMQQIREAPRRHLQAEAGLQQVGDLGQRQAAVGVQLHDQRDHTGTELCAGRPQRVGGLQGVPALDTPPTLRAMADLDVEAAHHWAHRRKVFLILRRRTGHFDRAARSPDSSSAPAPRWSRRPAPDTGGAPAGHSAHRTAGRDGRRDPVAASWRKVRLAGVPRGARLPTAVSGARSRAPAARSDAASRCSGAAGGHSHGARPCGVPDRYGVSQPPGPVAR